VNVSFLPTCKPRRRHFLKFALFISRQQHRLQPWVKSLGYLPLGGKSGSPLGFYLHIIIRWGLFRDLQSGDCFENWVRWGTDTFKKLELCL
jgi:hypothetical protein